MKKYLILISFYLVLSFSGDSAKRYLFSNLSLKDGLSQLTILSIYQDSQGFMWFGTRNGLNKYNGYTFERFLNKSGNTNSISNNHILSIVEDHYNHLWIGTNEGLNRIDLSTNTITRYFNDPNNPNSLAHNMVASLFVDRKGNLWIGTDSGLNLYRSETDDFILINPDNFFTNNPVNTIAGTKDKHIILGTMYRGVMVLDVQGDKSSYFVYNSEENNPKSLSSNAIRSVFVDSKENIWIGTIRNGLNFISNENYKKNNPPSSHFTQEKGLSNNAIRGINEAPDGKIIVGTSNGLNVIDPVNFQINVYNTYGSDRGNLSHYSIFPVFIDRSQTLWVGTYAGGVDYANPYGNKFRNFDVDSELKTITGIIGPIVENTDNLYIATEGGGLLCFKKSNETFKQYRLALNDYSYPNNIFKSLCLDGNKVLCGTTVGTIYSFDPRTEKFTLLYESEEKNSIYVLQRDSDGNLIIGGVNRIGLMSISPAGEVKKSFPLRNSETIEFLNVRSFLEINPGVFLIGTRNEGLFLYDKNKQTYKQYKKTEIESPQGLPENFIINLLKDSKGRIWVSAYGGGISLFDLEKETFTTYNSDAGLLDNSICSVVESNNGHLWVSSNAGLSDFNPENFTFTNYTSHNGININEFSLRSGIKTSNGTLFFGGNNGIVAFNPDYLDINPFVPPIVFENLYVNNERVIPGAFSILEKKLHVTNEIKLKYNQSNINIEYSALNYIFPEQNQYSYLLEGFDKNWNKVGNRRMAYYTNIPPGKYTFKVKASNNDGIWNEKGISLQITILPPIWKTWWAYSIYVLCILSIIYFIVRYFKERERLKNDIRLKQMEAKNQEEFHEARNRLFTNFSHELRTPLTLIMSPLDEIIEKEELKPELKSSMQTMLSNSHRMLRIVNNLMDFQKNESGMLKIKVSKYDIVRFIKEITLLFTEMASTRHIELLFCSSSESIMCLFDKNLMEKVMFNFMSNAVKNTPNHGKIELRLNQDKTNNTLLVEIADTGIGISLDDLEKIFIPFYQVSQSEHAHSGTGLGLSLSKSIIELHHGRVWAESDGKTGSTFKFVIPLSEGVFKNDEIATGQINEDAIQYFTDAPDENLQESEITPQVKYTLLVVEDNKDVRKYIKSCLEKIYNILEAGNGEEGLTRAFNHLPDLILTDLMMPKMDGVSMCLKLKNDIRTSHIPVIMITARTTPNDVFEGYETGADDYIAKPFNISLLKIRIKNILQSREKLKELYGKNFSLKTLGVEVKSLDEKFMQKLYGILEREIENSDLDMADFCKEIGISRSNLYRKIKAITNLSIGEFVRNFRLETAAKLLKQENVSISDVYVAVGFSSHSYFSNCFKAAYGVSPSEYAKGKE